MEGNWTGLIERAEIGVERLGFGTGPLGGLFTAVDDRDATDALACALANAIRFFDTAPLYGFGVAEKRLGDALAAAPTARTIVSTKVGRRLRPAAANAANLGFIGAPALEPYFDWTADGIRQSLESSLTRLGLERVDVAFLHDPAESDFDDVERCAYPALLRLRDEGIVGAIGAGMNKAADAVELLRRVDLDCVLIAGRLTLLDQSAAAQLVPLCDARGISVIVGGVFNSGILACTDDAARFDYAPAARPVLERARAIERICNEHGVPLAAAALQYPFRHSAVVSVVPGMRSAEEVEVNLRHFTREIPSQLWDALDATGLVRSPAAQQTRPTAPRT